MNSIYEIMSLKFICFLLHISSYIFYVLNIKFEDITIVQKCIPEIINSFYYNIGNYVIMTHLTLINLVNSNPIACLHLYLNNCVPEE
jgi:hypothetical protein